MWMCVDVDVDVCVYMCVDVDLCVCMDVGVCVCVSACVCVRGGSSSAASVLRVAQACALHCSSVCTCVAHEPNSPYNLTTQTGWCA